MDSVNRIQHCDRPSCDFRPDPDNPYRYVCLRCGLERSTKKSEPSKQSGVEKTLIWTILIVVGWLLWVGVDADRSSTSLPIPQTAINQVLP